MINKRIVTHTNLSGFFKMSAIKADGSRRVVSDWQPNLILDSGLDRFGSMDSGDLYTDGWMSHCRVGTGNSVPIVSQTNLDNSIAQATRASFGTTGSFITTLPYYRFFRISFTFAQGAATGNLTELGVGRPNPNNLSTRSLIKDTNGDPTSITILADEQLEVIYEIRTYVDSVPVVDAQYTIDSVLYDTKLADSAFGGSPVYDYGAGGGIHTGFTYIGTTLPNISADHLGAPTGQSGGNASMPRQPYSTGTYFLDSSLTLDINTANNGAKGVTAVQINSRMRNWQMSFTQNLNDYGIPHDNTNELTLNFRHSWSRYTPP